MSSDRRASAGTPDGPGQPATPGAPAAPATSGAPVTPGAPGVLSGACVVLPLVPGFVRPPARRRPLPDAVAVRMLPIPDSAPPYDDEPGGPAAAAGQRQHGQPLTGQPAGSRRPARRAGAPATPADGRRGRASGRSRAAAAGPAARGAGPGPAAPPGWPSQFAQVLAETLAGSRPQRQIAPWTTEQARRHIRHLGPLLAAGQQPRVRRVVTFRPATDVVEMTVIVGVGSRVRALAVRLERDGPRRASPGRDAQAARWVAVAVEAA